ncbi:hypothetical protein NP511_21830 [Natrinema thermotolerans]|uniref:Uncharacterized protein n=1 Tax=Natrinema thermotolerans TaxID=121872 RepID=A0AAF0PB98_9EURY|nr:hypothetical protein [Natrinema thermotolerans]QCC61788.1 hypothetical protein DVR14_24980 [Natrinema thermotolerans]WMT07992.1 hypothetical protein NP511_21830 [Natrinema thermotolerans]
MERNDASSDGIRRRDRSRERTPRDGTHTRRAALAASATALLTAVAGCTTAMDFIGDRLLEQVNVFNETDRRVAGSIAVGDPAGETVLDETFDLAPSESENDNEGSASGDDEQSVAVYDDVWGDAGSYEVTVELTDTEIDGRSRASETVTISDPDEQLLGVALGSEEVGEPIGFRVGESLSDLA